MTREIDYDEYFDRLESQLDEAWELASEARKRGEDPTDEIEIVLTDDMAERCEKFLEVDGLAERIRELAEEGVGREDMAFELTDEFLNDEIGDFDDPEMKIEYSIRTALALLTEAVVAAPIEGLQWVELEEHGGREYIRIKYGGPIRSAGGTAQVISVLIADYCRQHYGIDEFVPTDDEVERYVEEKNLYERDTGLQYTPSDDEVRTIIRNTPVMLDAEATTQDEVSGYRDLERIDTNGGRGGMCLVAFEGIAQKVPKLQKYTTQLDMDGWDWLTELPNASHVGEDDEEKDDDEADEDSESDVSTEANTGDSDESVSFEEPPKVKPKSKYIDDTLTAGRPIFSHPSQPGGFRLRYGRARNTGHAAAGFSPATMVLLNDFIAPGTQLKTERPGKAEGAAPVDGIEGPTVKMMDGEVRRIDDEEEARKLKNGVREILDLGEIAMPYGEYLENNAQLTPSSYVHEWWVQEAEESGLSVSDLPEERLNAAQALSMAEEYDIPLHPKFTYLWHDITLGEYEQLATTLDEAEQGEDLKLPIEVAEVLEKLLVPHYQHSDDLTVDEGHALILERCCAPDAVDGVESTIDAVREATGLKVRYRAPTRIGTRMGRPEKAERRTFRRDLNIHSLFPIGDEYYRDILAAAGDDNGDNQTFAGDAEISDLGRGEVKTQIAQRRCPGCGQTTWRMQCQDCELRTVGFAECDECGSHVSIPMEEMGETECQECENTVTGNARQTLQVKERLDEALDTLGERKGSFEKMKGVERLVSQSKIPEPLEKGVLRAKYDVGVYKDGTARYDVSDLPLTSFKPNEAGVEVEQLRELGYTHDMNGDPLEDGDQLVELRMQDVIVPGRAADYLLRVANFTDELLEDYYGLDPYYEADEPEDLVGALLIGMAPHTSAGTLCRVVGFSDAWAQYGHPFFHAAKRRNCFHPDTYVHVAAGQNSRYDLDAEDAPMTGKKIRDVVEPRLDDADAETVDDFGAQVVELDDEDNLYAFSLDDDGNFTRKPVNAVSKHPAPDHLVKFEIDEGTELTVTPGHRMLVVDDDGDIHEERAAGMKKGMEVPRLSLPPVGGTLDEWETDNRLPEKSGDVVRITDYEYVPADCEATYCLEVEDTHTLFANQIATKNCDGDEDAFMLLLDGLLNYSEQYLNHHKSGWSMDEPIVMSTRIDPEEIDDEAHNVDIESQYPLEFYEATYEQKGPKEVDIEIAEDRLDSPSGFDHTLETSSIDGGPEKSSYKTLPDMDTKVEEQFDVSRRARAVDETDVAERLIDGHFMADLKGNLRAFGTQKVRCTQCNTNYRRPPLEGECRTCGDDDSLILTVFEGSVTKYLPNMIEMSEKYDIDPYLDQIIDEYDRSVESLFENDQSKQSGLGDFM